MCSGEEREQSVQVFSFRQLKKCFAESSQILYHGEILKENYHIL